MRGNRVLIGLTLWLVAVTSVAGLAWVAIDSAGKSVTALPISPSEVSEQFDPTDRPGDPTEPTDPIGTVPSTVPTAPTVDPTGVSSGIATSLPTTSAAASARTGSSRPPVSASTTRPAPRPTATTPRLTSKTVSDYWGSVTFSCSGAVVRVQSASPANDWTMKPAKLQGPSIEIEFDGQGDAEVNVKGRCDAGRPVIEVQVSD